MRIDAGEPKGPLIGFAIKRSWSDKTGKFKIEGSLKSADAKSVQILKSDSKVIDVPVDKLSESDHAFVQGFLAAVKALSRALPIPEEDDENPFKGGVPSNGPSTDRPGRSQPSEPDRIESGGEPSAPGFIPKRKASINGFKPLSIVPAREFWSVSAPPRAFPDVSFEDAVIQTSLKKPFFAGLQAFASWQCPL